MLPVPKSRGIKRLKTQWDALYTLYFDKLWQDCSNSIANKLEILQACAEPSILLNDNRYLWNNKLASSSNITVMSQWAPWHLKSPASQFFTQPFVQVQIKENIKAPLAFARGNSLVTGEFTSQRVSNVENISIGWCLMNTVSWYQLHCIGNRQWLR